MGAPGQAGSTAPGDSEYRLGTEDIMEHPHLHFTEPPTSSQVYFPDLACILNCFASEISNSKICQNPVVVKIKSRLLGMKYIGPYDMAPCLPF